MHLCLWILSVLVNIIEVQKLEREKKDTTILAHQITWKLKIFEWLILATSEDNEQIREREKLLLQEKSPVDTKLMFCQNR